MQATLTRHVVLSGMCASRPPGWRTGRGLRLTDGGMERLDFEPNRPARKSVVRFSGRLR